MASMLYRQMGVFSSAKREKEYSHEQMHAAGAREPRCSGNPFLGDDDDEDDYGHQEAGHSSGLTAVPGFALPAFATVPPEASRFSTADNLQSRQEAEVSMPGKAPTDNQAHQSLDTASAVEKHSLPSHSAVTSSDAPPASALGMDRQGSSQHSGQGSSRAGQVSSRAGQTGSTMQQGSWGDMAMTPHPASFLTDQQPTGNQPEKPSLLTRPAVLSNESKTAAAAADTGARQQGSTGAGSALDRQANLPFIQEAVPASKADDRQPLPAAVASQPNQTQAGTLQEVQVLQPPEQGSQNAPHSLQCLDSQQQEESIRPGAVAEAQNTVEAQDMAPPLKHAQAASRQAQAGMSVSAQGPVNRGRASPALPLQLQGSFPRAPHPTANMTVYAPASSGDPSPRQGVQQGGSAPGEQPATGLEGMLGRSAPDSDTEEEGSEASAQDRQRFVQSLQSPDQGASRSRNLAKGFGRMRAKAKDMLQSKNAGSPSGPNTRSAQQAPSQGSSDGASHNATDTELGKRGRLARDMTLMFAGLKKPTNQQ